MSTTTHPGLKQAVVAALAEGALNLDAKPAYLQHLKLAEQVKLDGGGHCEVWDLEVVADA